MRCLKMNIVSEPVCSMPRSLKATWSLDASFPVVHYVRPRSPLVESVIHARYMLVRLLEAAYSALVRRSRTRWVNIEEKT